MVFIWIETTIRSLQACPHKYKNVLIYSAGRNWRLWSTLKSDFTIIKEKIKLRDKWSVLKTLSIIPLGQAVSTMTEQFYFFNGLLQGWKRNGSNHSLVNVSPQPKAFKDNTYILSWLNAFMNIQMEHEHCKTVTTFVARGSF